MKTRLLIIIGIVLTSVVLISSVYAASVQIRCESLLGDTHYPRPLTFWNCLDYLQRVDNPPPKSSSIELDPNPHFGSESDVMKKTKELGINNIMEAVDSEKLTSDEKLEYIKSRYEESPNNIPSMNIRIKDLTRNLEYGERPIFTLIETGYAIPCTNPNLEVYLLKQESGNDHTLDDLVYEDKIVYPCPYYDSFYPVLKFWDETDFKPFPVCEKEGRYLIVGDSGYERGSLDDYYCNAQGKE